VAFTVDNIRSLTDFRRNTKDYVGKLRESNLPLVLTVNGEAALVVQNAKAFQDIQDRLQQVEAELQKLKLEALTQDIQIGIDQLDAGEYTTYTKQNSATLVDRIKAKGRAQKANALG
jgi:PHD/YefM family antitoxin component YafN of YafNO toxin-antitoxin module